MPYRGNANLHMNYSHSSEVPWKIVDVLYAYGIIFSISLVSVAFLYLANFDRVSFLFPIIVQIVISAITLIAIYSIITKKYDMSFKKAMGIDMDRFGEYFSSGIFISFLLVISTSVITLVFMNYVGAPETDPYQELPADRLRMLAFLAVFIAPVVEEIFFRGFMQPALVKNFGIAGGIAVTAVVFGLSHAQYLDHTIALAAVTSIGLILGIAKEKTGSVMPCIVAHLLNNLYAALSVI